LLAWLTLLPVSTPLPVIWQRRDMMSLEAVLEGRGLWRNARRRSIPRDRLGRATPRAT
jgi:hypothetical protein